MKKIGPGILLLYFYLLPSGSFSTIPEAICVSKSMVLSEESYTLDTLTIYNPSRRQCDIDPFVTASNKKINKDKLRAGSVRWMALSRNMLKRWGGQLNYGDTIMLHTGDATIDGMWVIQDTMNKRFKNRGDLLFDPSLRSTGMWTNVTITRRKIYNVAPGKKISAS